MAPARSSTPWQPTDCSSRRDSRAYASLVSWSAGASLCCVKPSGALLTCGRRGAVQHNFALFIVWSVRLGLGHAGNRLGQLERAGDRARQAGPADRARPVFPWQEAVERLRARCAVGRACCCLTRPRGVVGRPLRIAPVRRRGDCALRLPPGESPASYPRRAGLAPLNTADPATPDRHASQLCARHQVHPKRRAAH